MRETKVKRLVFTVDLIVDLEDKVPTTEGFNRLVQLGGRDKAFWKLYPGKEIYVVSDVDLMGYVYGSNVTPLCVSVNNTEDLGEDDDFRAIKEYPNTPIVIRYLKKWDYVGLYLKGTY